MRIPAPADCSVELRDVWFKYAGSTSPFVLKGISTEIPQGKVTAVVGESGSGKSTLAKILLGLYEPFAGSLMLRRHRQCHSRHGAVDEALRGRDAGRNGLLGKYYLEYSTFR